MEYAPADGGARMHPRSGESSQLQSLKNGPTYREKFFAIFFRRLAPSCKIVEVENVKFVREPADIKTRIARGT